METPCCFAFVSFHGADPDGCKCSDDTDEEAQHTRGYTTPAEAVTTACSGHVRCISNAAFQLLPWAEHVLFLSNTSCETKQGQPAMQAFSLDVLS